MAVLALGAWPILPAAGASKKISSKIRGVAIGLAAYSLSTLPRQGILDTIVKTMVEFGIGDCELWWPLIEPAELADRARPARGGGGAARAGSGGGRAPVSPEQAAAAEELRKWHATVSLDYFKDIRKKFADAGIEISSLESSLGASPTDEELVRECQITKALGAGYLMINSPRSVAKRLAQIAGKQGVKIGLEGRPNMKSTDPNAISKPQDFEEALSYSKNFGLSIDVGDATGAGFDALKFVQDHHSRLIAMNMKDRTKAGASVPWGEGDSKIKEILQWVRDKKYPIRCYIDCDFPTVAGGSRVADVKRCLDFAKTVLTS